MTQYRFRNGFEDGNANGYAIAFQCCLDYHVEVEINGSWTLAKDVSEISTLHNITHIPELSRSHTQYGAH